MNKLINSFFKKVEEVNKKNFITINFEITSKNHMDLGLEDRYIIKGFFEYYILENDDSVSDINTFEKFRDTIFTSEIFFKSIKFLSSKISNRVDFEIELGIEEKISIPVPIGIGEEVEFIMNNEKFRGVVEKYCDNNPDQVEVRVDSTGVYILDYRILFPIKK
nr:MAG TPA: Phosphoribulokinase [Caudoviricetes sp.]